MKAFSLGLLSLALMRGFGNLELHLSAVSLCGWLHMIGAGRQISLQGGGCHTKSSVLSVIKRRKPSIISLYLVSSLGSSGSLYYSILVSISFPYSLRIHPLICGGKDQAMLLLG
jgi:hypothetical protein